MNTRIDTNTYIHTHRNTTWNNQYPHFLNVIGTSRVTGSRLGPHWILSNHKPGGAHSFLSHAPATGLSSLKQNLRARQHPRCLGYPKNEEEIVPMLKRMHMLPWEREGLTVIAQSWRLRELL